MRRKRLATIEAEQARVEEVRRLYELVAAKRHTDLMAAVEAVHRDVRSLRTKVDRDFKPTKGT